MHTISIYGTPPTAKEISDLRATVAREMSLGLKVMCYCTIPIVDLVAGAAVEAIDYTINGDRAAPLEDDRAATTRDWSATTTTREYVDHVRAQGRPLIRAEVEALERHVQLVGIAKDAAMGVGGLLVDGIKGTFSEVFNRS
ncbi:hypothetical protein [Azospirillum sp. sgz302134]